MKTQNAQIVKKVADYLIQRVLEKRDNPLVSYSELGKATGLSRNMYGPVLAKVGDLCLQNYLPDLTAIVVRKDTNKPGKAFLAHTPRSWLEVVRVQRYDWRSAVIEELFDLPLPEYDDGDYEAFIVLIPFPVLFLDTHKTDVVEGNFRAKPYNHETMPDLIVGHDRNIITDIKKPVAWFDLGNGRTRCEVVAVDEFAHLIGQPVPKYAVSSRNPVRYFGC